MQSNTLNRGFYSFSIRKAETPEILYDWAMSSVEGRAREAIGDDFERAWPDPRDLDVYCSADKEQRKQQMPKQSNSKWFILVLLGFAISGAVIYRLLGPVGDARGPGWRDVLQGGFVLLWMMLAAVVVLIISLVRRRKAR